MRLTTTILASSVFLITSSIAQAGGLSDEIMEAPVAVVEEAPAPGSSINSTFVIVGVLAALLIAAAVNANDDDDEPTVAASDVRLKEDINRIGTAENGLPVYSFRYIGEEQLYSGVMAQDVLMHTPQAVVMRRDGYLAVNYGILGISMEKLD